MQDARFRRAVERFDAINAEDPTRELDRGVERPHELLQSERLSTWIERLDPDASEVLRLAAHCQHLKRWAIPRSSFPEGRTGYLQWRTQLARFHADLAAEVLRDAGYDDDSVDAVRRINLKQNLRSNADSQTMEDALCLVFLEYEIEAFAAKHDDDKLVEILRKTWKKMSERGRARALELELSERVIALVKRALAPGAPTPS
jgi:hypothetical protein